MATKKTATILHNAVIARLSQPDEELRSLVQDMLSYNVAGTEHMNVGSWDGISSMFQRRKNQFPAGFVRYLRSRLQKAGYRVSIHSKPAPEPLGVEEPVVDEYGEDERYLYQRDTVKRLLTYKGMIAQVATGGGKSRIFKIAAERISRPTLFLTTRKTLMYQMADDYSKSLKKTYGIIGDSKWQPLDTGVTFAIVDTLASRLKELVLSDEIDKEVQKRFILIEQRVSELCTKAGLPKTTNLMRRVPAEIQEKVAKIRKKAESEYPAETQKVIALCEARVLQSKVMRKQTIEFLKKVEFVTLEEAHEVSSNSFYDVLNNCSNAWYRLALTATPFMKDDQEANMRLMAVSGPIGIRVSEKELIDKGILATPIFKFLSAPRPALLHKGSGWQRAYKIGIVENEYRNALIVENVMESISHGLTVMVLVNQTKHGELLKKMIESKKIKVEFIYGAHEQKLRQKSLDKLKDGRIQCLIGSTILDVGVDVPAIGMVIIAGGMKAEYTARQRIGRGLRSKKSGPNIALFVDFVDEHNNHLRGHAKERRRIIDETPGFSNQVVSNFDYSVFH